MFVKKSTYEAMRFRALKAEAVADIAIKRLNAKIEEWNVLVGRINAQGGEAFLAGRMQPAPQFTADELRSLIQLCHPDKHDGKQIATAMTAKLLKLKERVQ